MADRRKLRRKKEVNKVTLEPIANDKGHSPTKINIAFTNDVSLCGLKIITDTNYPVNSLMKVDISLKQSQEIINVTGKVRWVTDLANDTYEIGIEILDITRENIRIFYEHLYKYINEK